MPAVAAIQVRLVLFIFIRFKGYLDSNQSLAYKNKIKNYFNFNYTVIIGLDLLEFYVREEISY